MLVKDVMNMKAPKVSLDATMGMAADLLAVSNASDLVVVDHNDEFIGVLSEGDLLRMLIPDYDEVTRVGGSLRDAYRYFIDNGKDMVDQPIERLIIRNPITASPEEELLKVATVMSDKMLRRLPIVSNGMFVGTLSRADVAWAVLHAHRFSTGHVES